MARQGRMFMLELHYNHTEHFTDHICDNPIAHYASCFSRMVSVHCSFQLLPCQGVYQS